MENRAVTVLLVDDNEVDVEGVQRAFVRHRIANPIRVARDGLDALEQLRTPAEEGGIPRPYLILLDLNMPRMNGIECLTEIRKDPDLASSIVFILTTSANEADKVQSYDLNIAGYILKSEVGEGFLKLVEMLDHYWRVIEFPPESAQ